MNQLSLSDSYFTFFNFPERFVIDAESLDVAFRAIQNQVHPDKFADGNDAEKRRAMQWATHANAAYQTLKHPLRRATYLCELHGESLQAESNTAMPREFLMQQMEWREALDEARSQKNLPQLEQLDQEVSATRRALQAKVAQEIDEQANYHAAAQSVRQWMFIEKMRTEVHGALETLEN